MIKSLPKEQSAKPQKEQDASIETSEEQDNDFSLENPKPYGFESDDLEDAMTGFNINRLHERRI